MAKARREVTEKLKQIDVVFELVDARIPQSSRNPMIDELVSHKPRLILLNKADLSDPAITAKWIHYFEQKGHKVISIDSQSGKGTEQIASKAQELASDLLNKLKAKGMKPRAIRALILGIPNVGKSTLINRLAKKKIAKTGDRPGITKQQQWIKVGSKLELLDTPGILWPKFEDEQVGYRLAATGAIKDEILDYQDIAAFLLKYLIENYPNQLRERYKIQQFKEDIVEVFDEIGKSRGLLMSGGHIDYDKVAELILREFRSCKIGKISLEKPE